MKNFNLSPNQVVYICVCPQTGEIWLSNKAPEHQVPVNSSDAKLEAVLPLLRDISDVCWASRLVPSIFPVTIGHGGTSKTPKLTVEEFYARLYLGDLARWADYLVKLQRSGTQINKLPFDGLFEAMRLVRPAIAAALVKRVSAVEKVAIHKLVAPLDTLDELVEKVIAHKRQTGNVPSSTTLSLFHAIREVRAAIATFLEVSNGEETIFNHPRRAQEKKARISLVI
jgi:hypothetical protein